MNINYMKKYYFVLFFILVNVFNLSAQSDKMLGKWKYEYEIFKDTSQVGRDTINKSYEAYMSGKKTLASEFIFVDEKYVRDENTTYEIKLVKKQYWLMDLKSKEKWELVYNAKDKTFTSPVIHYGVRYIISCDPKSGNRLFFDRFYGSRKTSNSARSFYKKV